MATVDATGAEGAIEALALSAAVAIQALEPIISSSVLPACRHELMRHVSDDDEMGEGPGERPNLHVLSGGRGER